MESQKDKYNKLSPEEKKIIIDKGTEIPFSGEYYDFNANGTYVCKQCNTPLYNSSDKFNSGCGWPSFDDEIEGAVKKVRDKDGIRTEIICASCNAHLGHVFIGEGFTAKNTRHCVNSISLKFVPAKESKTDTAYFASGCFWGTEYYLQKVPGVISTTVGYCGGEKEKPSYEDVCSGTTGHAETVQVIFDSEKTNFESLTKLFFETHDPTQINRQGPDIGTQYRSVIFYTNDKQKEIAEKLIAILKTKGYKIATHVDSFKKFWPAETYHQDYYNNTGGVPYCHKFEKKF